MSKRPPLPQRIDTLFDEYSKGLYRITGTEASDSILDMINGDAPQNNSASVTVSPSDISSGVSSGIQQTATGSTQSGKTLFDNTTTGYILGFDPKDGMTKFYIGNTTTYLNWTGSSLIVTGTIQTAASGTRIVIDSSANNIKFYVGAELTQRITMGTDSSTTGTIQINNPASSGKESLVIFNSTQSAIDVTNSSSAGLGITLVHASTSTALSVTDSANHTSDSASLYVNKTGVGSGYMVRLRNEGTGIGMYLENNVGAIGSATGLNIEHYGSGNALLITSGDVNLGGNRLINLKTSAGAPDATATGAYGVVYDASNDKLYFNNNGTLKSVQFT